MIIVWGKAATAYVSSTLIVSSTSGATALGARGNIDYDQLQVAIRHGYGTKVQMNDGVATTSGHLASYDTTGNVVDSGIAIGSVGGGSVTSVGLALPAIFTVTVSPITSSGSLTATLATQSANLFFAGPTTGSAATPTFRTIAAADLPLGSSSAFGAVKVDGTTVTASAGVISIGQAVATSNSPTFAGLLVTTASATGSITADGATTGIVYVSHAGTVYGAIFTEGTKFDINASQAGGTVPLTFDVAAAERARFDTSGNFIVGATAVILAGTLFNAKLGTNANSTSQPAGTWATVIYNATNTAAYNGLFVKNNYRASGSTTFEVGVDAVGGAYESHFKITGDGMISCPGNVYTTVASLPAGPTGGIYYCPDAKNQHDDAIVVGTVAVTGGHGAYVCYINGSWRTMC